MKIDNLRSLKPDGDLSADVVIIGGGPAGFAIARELRGTKARVLILESGELDESPLFETLNAVESAEDGMGEAQVAKRKAFHSANAVSWSHDLQTFGVRCRALGGSSNAWAGKSAPFDEIDFSARDWVPNSGWPFNAEVLQPYVDRAAELLNLGPSCFDEGLWTLLGIEPPQPSFDPALLQSFFWQFSRSRSDKMDVMRFGREFEALDAPNIQVLINATVTDIQTNEAGTAFKRLQVSTIGGIRRWVHASIAVLAAGGIENARLLLSTGRARNRSIGNQHDLVGRFLMDHPSATVGRFRAEDCRWINDRFGFYGLAHQRRVYMYMHGLVLSPAIQKREQLLNCAAYMMEERASDDPWDALKRILRAKTNAPIADLVAVASSPGLLARGAGARLLQSNIAPKFVKDHLIAGMIRHFPNSVAREYRDRGLPHKLTGITIDTITEQVPDPESRIFLSDQTDALGVPIAKANWRVDRQARQSLVRLGQVLEAEFTRVGLPTPILEPWVTNSRPEDSVIIDMAHTSGTTRMSDDPKAGVVNSDCQIHGVANLYIAGASVFPTSGHANPMLMILALAIRLADHIKTYI